MITPDQQISIVREIASICDSVAGCGVVVPAPIFFVDKSDFQRNVGDHTLSTQKANETSEVAFTTITFSKPPAKPNVHGGWWTCFFNIYIFREYDAERLDESVTPDEFRKKILKSYFDFINSILDLQTEFGEEREMEISFPEIIQALAFLEASDDFIEENEFCVYVPGVKGFSVNLPLEIKIRFREC